MRRRRRVVGVDAEQLASVDPDVWMTPVERARVVDLFDDARRVWAVEQPQPGAAPAETMLDRLAPAARYPARLIEDRAEAVRVTEHQVVAFRRRLAGWRYAAASGEEPAVVAARFGLGYLSRPSADDGYWLAAGPIE